MAFLLGDTTLTVAISIIAILVPIVMTLIGIVISFFRKLVQLDTQVENHEREITRLRDEMIEWVKRK